MLREGGGGRRGMRRWGGGPRRPRAPPARRRRRRRPDLLPWAFLAPALILFALFKFVPMARAVSMSFYEVRPYLGDRWVGTDNFVAIGGDDAFGRAIWQTLLLAVGQTAGSLLIGLVLALLLEGQARSPWFVRPAV